MTEARDHGTALANAVAIAGGAAMILALALAVSVGSPAAISTTSSPQAASPPAPTLVHATVTAAHPPATTSATPLASSAPTAAPAAPATTTTPTASATPPPVAGPFEGDLTIPAGTTVIFTNNLGDGEPHSVTARDGSFDTGLLVDGQSASITFNTPGKYPYYCVIHANMFGTITVTK